MRLVFITLLLVTLPLLGYAQETADSEFVDYYFGTKVVMTTGSQIGNSTNSYWAELLPQEYMYHVDRIVGIINDQRTADGRADLLDEMMYPVEIGYDDKLEDGSWTYELLFRDCTPEEAQLVLDTFGLGEDFAGAELSFEPIKINYFYADSENLEEIFALDLPGGLLEVDPRDSVAEVIEAIDRHLSAFYGENYATDLYYSIGRTVTGPDYVSFSITIYLDGVEEDLDYGYYDY